MLERITDFMAHPDLIFGWVARPLLAAARHPHCTTVLTQHMLLASAPSERTFCDMLCWPRLFPVPRFLRLEWIAYMIPRLDRSAELCEEPEERFIRVLQYYLAGWHIKPKGVKKP